MTTKDQIKARLMNDPVVRQAWNLYDAGAISGEEFAARRTARRDQLLAEMTARKESRQAMRRRLTRQVMDYLRHDTDAQGAAMVVFDDASAEAWIPDDDKRADYGYGIVRFCEKALRYA